MRTESLKLVVYSHNGEIYIAEITGENETFWTFQDIVRKNGKLVRNGEWSYHKQRLMKPDAIDWIEFTEYETIEELKQEYPEYFI